MTGTGRRAFALLGRIAVAALLLAVVAALVGPQRLQAQLRSADPVWFVVAVALSTAAQSVSALRWSAIARALGLRAPPVPLVLAYAQGIALNVLLPGATLGGDTLRSVRLRRLGNPLAESALSVVLDRLSGLWVLCLMSLCAGLAGVAGGGLADVEAALRHAGVTVLPLAGTAIAQFYVAGLVAAIALPFLPWRFALPGRAAMGGVAADAGPAPREGRWMRLHRRLAELHALVVSRRGPLARSLWGSILVQLLSAAALWGCARAAGEPVGYGAVLAVSAPVFVAAAVPVSIGGFGPRELAALVFFPLVGIAPQQGVAAAALYGLAAVVLGIACSPLLAWVGRGGTDGACGEGSAQP